MKIIENLSCKYKAELWYSEHDMNSFKCGDVQLMSNVRSMNMSMTQFAEMNIQDTSLFMWLEIFLSKTHRKGFYGDEKRSTKQ